MAELNYGKLMESDGQEIDGKTITILPREWLELQIEIISNHPQLANELATLMQNENGDVNVWYGAIAAYLGIVLEGGYSQLELCEQFTRGLINKREGLVVAADSRIVPISKELLQ